MKTSITKEWFRSRAPSEAGKSIEARAPEPQSSGSDQRLVRNLPSIVIFGVTWAAMILMFIAAALLVLAITIPFSPILALVVFSNTWGPRLCDWWWEQARKGRRILFPNADVQPRPDQPKIPE